jgi:hypothetical protein
MVAGTTEAALKTERKGGVIDNISRKSWQHMMWAEGEGLACILVILSIRSQ